MITWYPIEHNESQLIQATCVTTAPHVQQWSSISVLSIKSSVVANKAFCQCELLSICDVTLLILLPLLNWLSELSIHRMSIHHNPPSLFIVDSIPQNNAFHYWDTTATCILNMLSKVWVEIWHFWLCIPVGKTTIPGTLPFQGVLKIAHDSCSDW